MRPKVIRPRISNRTTKRLPKKYSEAMCLNSTLTLTTLTCMLLHQPCLVHAINTEDVTVPRRVQGVAKRYCDFLLSPSSAFHMERMNAWLNGVKTMTLLKHIVACDLAGVLVTPSDAPPCGSHLSWDFLQSAGVLSLEPVWTFPKVPISISSLEVSSPPHQSAY